MVASLVGRSIGVGFVGTFWITTYWKKALFDQRCTALEFRCEVARYSPEGEKSIERGAFLNLTQSTREPVTIS